MGTGKTFIKNSFANYGQKIIRSGIGILTIGIIARYLSTADFGQYAFILALITISEVTAGMGVPMILCREVAKERAKAPRLLAAGLILQAILATVTISIIGVVFYVIAPSSGVFYAALICGVAELFRFLARFLWAIYQAYEKMGFGTLQAFVTQSLYLLLLIVATSRDLGLHGIFGALLVAHLAGCIFGYILVTKIFTKPEFAETKGLCKFLFKEAYPLAIKGIFRKLNYRAGTLLLAWMKTIFHVGMFNGPYKIVLQLVFLSEASSQAIFPVFARLTETSKGSLSLAYEKSLKFALILGLPVAIFLSCFSQPIIALVLGQKYIATAGVLEILGWALVPIFLTSFIEKTLVAGNKQHLTTVSVGLALGVHILLNLLLIPRMNYMGAGIAAFASEMVVAFCGVYFVLRHFGFRVRLRDVVKPLFGGLVTYMVLRTLGHLNVFLGGVLAVGIYTAVLFGIRTFSEEEISFFKQLWRGASSPKPVRI
ncbi:MAG: flippase [Planctomycetota bacterium]|jgi:O-antigen/teichoic acid export membrane protein